MKTLAYVNSHILDMRKCTWADSAGKEFTFNQATWKDDVQGLVGDKYELKKKTYIRPDEGPEYYMWWVRYDQPRCREFQWAKNTLPASAVSTNADPYWPEGFEPDASGYFLFGDLVLMKRKYSDYLKDEIERLRRSKGSAKAKIEEYEEQARREGVELTVDQKGLLGSKI